VTTVNLSITIFPLTTAISVDISTVENCTRHKDYDRQFVR